MITSNEIKNNAIIVVNGTPVWSLAANGEHTADIVSTTNYDNNRDLLRDVMLQGTLIGTLRIHASINKDSMHLQDNAGVQESWLGGSTNSPK